MSSRVTVTRENPSANEILIAQRRAITSAVFLTGALFASGWRMWVLIGLLVATGPIRVRVRMRRGR